MTDISVPLTEIRSRDDELARLTTLLIEQPARDSLEFVAGVPGANTGRAVAFDLNVFFTVVDADPVSVRPSPRVRVPRSSAR